MVPTTDEQSAWTVELKKYTHSLEVKKVMLVTEICLMYRHPLDFLYSTSPNYQALPKSGFFLSCPDGK
jgi:hypothetical protein